MLAQMCLQTEAQIPAPDPICVSKDTILWNLPDVTCGKTKVYEIYVANSLDGPYHRLIVIIDTTQTKYWHQNASGETRYYYMITQADCPGMTSLHSDTINNIPPPKIPISYVTVENNDVRIVWEESKDARVEGYIIYKATPSGTIPIDTVYNGSSYIDKNAAVNEQSEYYYVLSIDKCGNPGLFDIVHRTILLDAEIGICSRTITLHWNPYEGWGDELESYRIYQVDPMSGDEKLIGTTSPDSLSFTVPDIIDMKEYCFLVRAMHSDGNRASASQVLCLKPDIAQGILYNNIYKVSVMLDGTVEVYWEWNTDAQVEEGHVQSTQVSTGGEVQRFPFNNLGNIMDNGMITDDINKAGAGAISYEVITTDVCDSVFKSKDVSSLYLNVQTMPDFNIGMNWTAFTVEKASSIRYFIERIVNNAVVETIPLTGSDSLSSYKYPYEPNNLEIYSSCYRLGVHYTYTYEDGSREQLTMYSNLACPAFEIKVQVPNAMVYHGVNDRFQPLFLTPNLIDEYTLEVYSRYGQKVFSTHDINMGWNGTMNGQAMPQGVYIYKIIARKRDKKKMLQGTFMLLR